MKEVGIEEKTGADVERKGSAFALTFQLDTSLFILHEMCVMSVLMVGFRLIVSWSHHYYE